MDYGLSYDGDHDFTLSGYTDADWAGSVADRKSTSGCCFSLGSTMISWQSRKQSSIALSTAGLTNALVTLKSCRQWQRHILLLFDALITYNRTWEVHLNQLDETGGIVSMT
jgi:hypothetical protein